MKWSSLRPRSIPLVMDQYQEPTPSLRYFDEEVVNHPLDFGKPVRCAFRHDDHITFRQYPRRAAFTARPAPFARSGLFCVNQFAAGNEGGSFFNDINLVCLLLWNPVLIERRMCGGPGTKTWDKVWIVMFMATVIGMYVIARHDLNPRGEDPSPSGILWLIGVAMFVFGWTILTWSMVTNPFFEKTVRIQTEHGHRVIDNGPYAYIRHPGYVGFSALLFSTPLLLASALSFLPALLAALGFVIRTALEDRTLQAELSGYTEYAASVRFRLIPGVW